ncbi:MAG TPA: Gfo/Idh/MocA family oxidoreductase [Planctomycetota bacterium]|nr:Gfo/Idh/MocA family oxidoreductase [Planctomycetota bacterium]
MTSATGLSRRDFMKNAAAAGAALGGLSILGATAKGQGRVLKVGLIGCGGRGNGALAQHVEAARILNGALKWNLEIQVAAVADYFKHKARPAAEKYGVTRERCFSGAEAYKRLLETDVEIVLMATPPAFRPLHFEAAVKAGKHIFMEKPAGVDPPGCRRVIAAGEEARKKGLMVIAGTHCRHQKNYTENQAAVAAGAIGRILGGRVSSCFGHLGALRPIGSLDPRRLVYSWPNWTELSGDFIVEAHIHELDLMNWFLGTHPVSAVGFGGRARRPAGNQYDFFSVDYEFPGEVHIHSTCRQMNGCWNWDGELFVGERGISRGWQGVRPKPVVPAEIPQQGAGHQQEQIDLLYYLVKGQLLNQAHDLATSTATAVMGRISAYTGQKILWREMMEDPARQPELYNLQLKPTAEDFEGDFDAIALPEEGVVPLPGTSA